MKDNNSSLENKSLLDTLSLSPVIIMGTFLTMMRQGAEAQVNSSSEEPPSDNRLDISREDAIKIIAIMFLVSIVSFGFCTIIKYRDYLSCRSRKQYDREQNTIEQNTGEQNTGEQNTRTPETIIEPESLEENNGNHWRELVARNVEENLADLRFPKSKDPCISPI